MNWKTGLSIEVAVDLRDDIMDIEAARIPRVPVDVTIVNGVIRYGRSATQPADRHQSPS
jgi:hypothetical protein